jgi:PAS domain S-box-containing protein
MYLKNMIKLSIEKKVVFGFGLASAVLVSINALSYWSFSKHRSTAYWVAHTYQVQQKIDETLAALVEAETEQRRYLITGGDNSSLDTFEESVASTHRAIQELRILVADNPHQQRRIDILDPLVTKRLSKLSQILELRRDKGFEAARDAVKTGLGKKFMTQIQQLLREMNNEEAILLKQRIVQREAADRTQIVIFSVGIVFNAVVFYCLYRAISHEIARRKQAQATVQKVNEQLEHKVEERTAALQDKVIALQQAEVALQDNYTLLRTVIDSSPNAIYVKDKEGCYRLMNTPGASLFNKSVEEIIGQDDTAFLPPEVAALVKANDSKILANGTCEILEETIFVQGEWRTYLATKSVYRDSSGNIEGLVGFSRDITRLKQAQEALQQANAQLEQKVEARTAELVQANAALAESEQRLRLFIENAPSAIAMFDCQMRYLAVSRRWLTDYSLGEQDIIGRSHYEVFPSIPERWKQEYQSVLDGEIVKCEEDSFQQTDGRTDWLRYELHPWYNSTGEVGGIIMFMEVITFRKEAERKLQLANAELTRSNQELEQFAYVASHDLREPLRKIKSYTELLDENYQGQLDAKADKYITYIVDGTVRMQNLITDLLTYSRVGKGDVKQEPVALGTVLEQTLTDLSSTIEENSALVTVKPLPTVKANPTQMVQLFQNLIANALKFRREATPEIHVEAQLQDDRWLICVRDNGIGIKPQYLERIFEIFQRLHSRDKYPGTGIGLAICRKIVKSHGGSIWVESEPGLGTTFYFSLPTFCSLL